MLYALLTVSLASAQSPRVDPAYLAYLVDLDTVGAGAISTGEVPQPQLWPGMVGVVSLDFEDVATVVVGGAFPKMTETWYLREAFVPGDAFVFLHEGALVGDEVVALEAADPEWDLHPCQSMSVKYVVAPNAALTANLDYTPGIDRYTFDLWQGGVVVGRLLCEHHHVAYMPEQFVDHWAFAETYAPPAAEGDELWVLPAGKGFATTTAFFTHLANDGTDYWRFAQIKYSSQIGFQCQGGGLLLP